MEEEEYSLISSAADEANKQFITEYAKRFQHKKAAALTNNTSFASTTDHESSVASEESSKDQTEKIEKEEKKEGENQVAVVETTNTNTTEDSHKRMLELINNGPSRKIFLDILVRQRDPSKDLFEIKLGPKSYDLLQDLLVKMLKGIV